ncbi:MAG: nucleotidyltransferase domain-containing protein [candidate division WOR-3 bacterium]
MTNHNFKKTLRKGNDRKIKIYLNELKKVFGKELKKAILFGSRARGDNSADSDYDFCLIFDKVTPKVKKTLDNLSVEMLLKYGMIITDFALTERDLERKRFNPLIMNIQKEGIPL